MISTYCSGTDAPVQDSWNSWRLPACRSGLRLPAGACAVVTNGRVVELSPSDDFSPLDFQLLDLHATRSQFAGEAATLVAVVKEEIAGGWGAADVAAVVSSVLAAHQPEEVGWARYCKGVLVVDVKGRVWAPMGRLVYGCSSAWPSCCSDRLQV